MSSIAEERNQDTIAKLRDRVEETDLERILKPSFGGYTKNSVHNYLTTMKRQQQSAAEIFDQNYQMLLVEKEKLKKTNELLESRLKKEEDKYKNIQERLQSKVLENSTLSMNDFITLQDQNASLNEEKKQWAKSEELFLAKMNQKEDQYFALREELEQVTSELQGYKEVVLALKEEKTQHLDRIQELTHEIELKEVENDYLVQQMTDGELSLLKTRIHELSDELIFMNEMMEAQASQIASWKTSVQEMEEELSVFREESASLRSQLVETEKNNDKLAQSNGIYRQKLEEQYQYQLQLIREKSDLFMERLTAEKLLQETKTKLTLLEMRSQDS